MVESQSLSNMTAETQPNSEGQAHQGGNMPPRDFWRSTTEVAFLTSKFNGLLNSRGKHIPNYLRRDRRPQRPPKSPNNDAQRAQAR